METAREGNPYDAVSGGGFGAGGKFRKRPFRRAANTTPYDRPPTARRNPSIVNPNNNGNGWLSRLVDPAQRLIASSAHRLFSSVFRKRLGPPAPQQQTETPSTSEANREVRDEGLEARDNHHEAVVTDARVQGGIDQVDNSRSSFDRGGLTELEQVLKQKTFTRSEIDRLTALLQSRTVDINMGDKEKKSEVIPPEAVVPHDRREEFPKAPASENGVGSHLISSPLISSTVLDEDVASPAELAKAYMDRRPSKVSPSMLGIRAQGFVEDSMVISKRPFLQKSPVLPLVPRSSGHTGYLENGFTTPGSRGKSAIYSMARTPYSRVHPASTLKGVWPVAAYDGSSSSSQAAWEQNRLSGSKQGALKRRSSVLDNDLGSVGPIRRIRHKPSLLSSRGLSFPVSESPVSIRGIGVDAGAFQYASPSVQKPRLLNESRGNLTKLSTENGDNSMPATSFPPVSSKSSEMASKILEQLEKLVSPKEKSSQFKLGSLRDSSPTKLSPSMLQGKALRSLETVESPKLLENVRDNNKLDTSFDTLLPDALDTTYQKLKKVEENGPLKLVAPYDRSLPVINNMDHKVPNKDTLSSIKTADSAVTNSVTYPSQKKRAFQMSAQEDFLELDDDHPDAASPNLLVEEREKVDVSVAERKNNSSEEAMPHNPPSLLGFKPPASSDLNKKSDSVTTDGPVDAEKGTGFSFSRATSPNMAAQPAMVVTQSSLASDKSAPPRESNASPSVFSFGDKIASPNLPNAGSTVASLVSTSSADKVPQFTFVSSSSAGFQFGVSSDPKPESTGSFLTVSATDSVPKVSGMDGTDNKNNSTASITSKKPETSIAFVASPPTPAASIGASTTTSNTIFDNGSFASNPLSVSSPVPAFDFNGVKGQNSSNIPTFAVASTEGNYTNASATASATTSATTFTTITNSSSLSTSVGATPSFSATPVFKFGSSVSSTSASSGTAASGIESEAGKTRPDASFGNLSSVPFVCASTGNASAGSTNFGFSASITSETVNNKSQGSLFGSGNGSVLSAQASTAGSGISTFSSSMPFQFGSSASSPSLGIAGNTNTTFSSGSSLFAASTPAAKLFNSAAAFGQSSSASSSEGKASSTVAGATSSLFGSSGQSTKSPSFGSTFNSASSSPGLSFTGSTASVTATTSTPTAFSFPATSASVPANTTPSTGFPFSASMAGAAGTSPSPVFGFAASAPSVAVTSSSPIFGSSVGASSGPAYSFNSSGIATTSQPGFGNPSSGFGFTSASSGNNDQMNMEDSMAEDTVQASTPAVPAFSPHPVPLPQSSFVFGSTPPSTASPFNFGAQQNSVNAQNQFQATNSLGGSFSLGTGGGEKSGRKIIKINRKGRKK